MHAKPHGATLAHLRMMQRAATAPALMTLRKHAARYADETARLAADETARLAAEEAFQKDLRRVLTRA